VHLRIERLENQQYLATSDTVPGSCARENHARDGRDCPGRRAQVDRVVPRYMEILCRTLGAR